jgi:hypothetical protein
MTLHCFRFQWFHCFAGICLGFHSTGQVPRFTCYYQLSSTLFAHRRGHQDAKFLLPRSTAWDTSQPSPPRCSTRTRPCKTQVRPIIQEYWVAWRTHLARVVEKIPSCAVGGWLWRCSRFSLGSQYPKLTRSSGISELICSLHVLACNVLASSTRRNDDRVSHVNCWLRIIKPWTYMHIFDTFLCSTFIILLLRVKWCPIYFTGVSLLCTELVYVLCLHVILLNFVSFFLSNM